MELAKLVNHEIVETLGVTFGAIYVVEPEGTFANLIASHAWPTPRATNFTRLPIAGDDPVGRCLQTARPVWIGSRTEFRERFPAAEASAPCLPPNVSLGAVPMQVNGRVAGALMVTFETGRELDQGLRDFLVYLAAVCAQALERESLHGEVTRAKERLGVLAVVGELLSSSLDYEKTLHNVVRSAMPAVGDFGFFDLVEGPKVRRLAYAHEDSRRQALLDPTQWVKNERRDMNLCALSSGQTGLHAEIDDEWLQKVAVAPPHLALMRALSFQSMLTVPLRYEGELLGALTLFFVQGGRRHTHEDVHLAEDIANRAASAVMNARLYRDATIAEREARHAVRGRDDFLSIASHELRTPLSTLEMNLSLILKGELREATQPASLQVERLEKCSRQVERLKNLVSHLLDVSQISSNRLNLSRERFDLALLVRELLERTSDAGMERVQLVLPEGEVVGEWDRSRVEQVVTNLLSNALKYGGSGPIRIELASEDACAKLAVKDQGIGIPPEDQERIFARFERAVPPRNYGGFGLGLWISREIVLAHGGALEVESEPGNGSTFTMSLPLNVENVDSGR